MARKAHPYAVEKLTVALSILATGKGDARQRVGDAYLACHVLQDRDLPKEHRETWQWITAEVTKFGPIYGHDGNVWVSSVENTMRNRKNATASKIAKKLWDLYWALSENTEYE